MADFALTAQLKFQGVDKAIGQVKKKLTDIVTAANSPGGSARGIGRGVTDSLLSNRELGALQGRVKRMTQVMNSSQLDITKLADQQFKTRSRLTQQYFNQQNSGYRAMFRTRFSLTKQHLGQVGKLHQESTKNVMESLRKQITAINKANSQKDASNTKSALNAIKGIQQSDKAVMASSKYQIELRQNTLKKQQDIAKKTLDLVQKTEATRISRQLKSANLAQKFRISQTTSEASILSKEGTGQQRITNMTARINRRADEGMLPTSQQVRMTKELTTAYGTYSKALRQSAGDKIALAKATNEFRASTAKVGNELTAQTGLYKKLDMSARSFGDSIGRMTVMGQGLQRFIYATSVALTALSGAFGFRQIYDAIVSMDTFKNTMKAVSGDASIASANISFLVDTANKLGVSIQSVGTPFAQFTAAAKQSGMSMNQTQSIFTKLMMSTKNFGLSAADTSGVIRALTQSMSKGTFQAEEIRQQLGDRMPVAMQALAQATGKTTAQLMDMMKKGQLTTKEYLVPFVQAMLKMSGGQQAATRASQTMQSAVARLGNAFTVVSSQVAGPNGFTEGVKNAANAMTDFIKSSEGAFMFTAIGKAVQGVAYAIKVLAQNFNVLISAITAFVSLKILGFFTDMVKGIALLSPQGRMLQLVLTGVAAAVGLLTNYFIKSSQAKIQQEQATKRITSANNFYADSLTYTDQQLGKLQKSKRQAIKTNAQHQKSVLNQTLAIQKKALASAQVEQQNFSIKYIADVGVQPPQGNPYQRMVQKANSAISQTQLAINNLETAIQRVDTTQAQANIQDLRRQFQNGKVAVQDFRRSLSGVGSDMLTQTAFIKGQTKALLQGGMKALQTEKRKQSMLETTSKIYNEEIKAMQKSGALSKDAETKKEQMVQVYRAAALAAREHTDAVSQNSAAIQAARAAQSAGKKASRADEAAGNKYAKMMDQLDAEIQGNKDLAEAELLSSEAKLKATAHREALTKAAKGNIDAYTSQFQILVEKLGMDKALLQAGKSSIDIYTEEFKAIQAKTTALQKQKAAIKANQEIKKTKEELQDAKSILQVSSQTGVEREKAIRHIELMRKAQTDLVGKTKQQKEEWIKQNETLDDTKRKSKQVQDAWDTVANSLEKAFDQVGQAIVNAIVQGKGAAVDFKKIMKGLAASIISEFAKLAIANPIKNMLFSSGAPTIFDMFGGSAKSGIAGSGGSNVTAQGQSTGGGLGDMLGLSKLFSGGSGKGFWDMVGLPKGMDTVLFNYAAPIAPTIGTGVGVGGRIAQGATTGLGTQAAAGSGFTLGNAAGGLGAAFSAFNAFKAFQSGNVIGGVGNAVGAAAGVASMIPSLAAMIPGLQFLAIAGPLLGSLLGKAKVKHPAASVAFGVRQGEFSAVSASSKHMGTEDIMKFGTQVSKVINSTVKELLGSDVKFAPTTTDVAGVVFDQKTGKFNVRGQHLFGDFDNAEDAMKQILFNAIKFIPKTGVGQDIATAIKNSVAQNLEDLGKDIAFAKGFDDVIASLKSNIGLQDTVRKQANQSIKNTIKQFQDFKKKTEQLFPAVSVTTGQIKSMKTVMEEMDLTTALNAGKVNVTKFEDDFGRISSVYRDLSGNILQIGSSGKLLVPVLKEVTDVIGSTETTLSKQLVSINQAMKVYVDNMVNAVEPKTYTTVQAAVIAMQQTWKEMGPLLQEVGYTVDQVSVKIKQGLTNNLKKLSKEYTDSLDSQIRSATGQDYINQIFATKQNNTAIQKDLTALGLPMDKAKELFDAQIKNILSGLDSTQLKKVVQVFGDEFNKLIETIQKSSTVMQDLESRRLNTLAKLNPALTKEAQDYDRKLSHSRELASVTDTEQLAIIKKIHTIEDAIVVMEREREATEKNNQVFLTRAALQQRALGLTGDTVKGTMAQFDLQASQQLQQALLNGTNTTELSSVLGGQRAKLLFETNKQELLDAQDRQIRAIEDNNTRIEQNSGRLLQLRTTLKDAADSMLISESSPLSPQQRLEEARRQFSDLLATYNNTSLSEEQRYTAGGKLQSTGQSLIELASTYYGSSNRSDFDMVVESWKTIGNVSQDQLDETQKLIDSNNQQLVELRKAREETSRLGQKQVGSIDELTKVTRDSYDLMLTAVKNISTSLLNTSNTSRLPTAAAIQTANTQSNYNASFGGDKAIASSQGFTGQLGTGEYWKWLLQDTTGTRMRQYVNKNETLFSVMKQGGLYDTFYKNKANASTLDENFAKSIGYTGKLSGGDYVKWLNSDTSMSKWSDLALWLNRQVGTSDIKGYATGGFVSNGAYGVDSVFAKLAGGQFVMPAPSAATYSSQLSQMRNGSYASNDNDDICQELVRLREENSLLMKQLISLTAMSGQANIDGLNEVVTVQKSQKDLARAG